MSSVAAFIHNLRPPFKTLIRVEYYSVSFPPVTKRNAKYIWKSMGQEAKIHVSLHSGYVAVSLTFGKLLNLGQPLYFLCMSIDHLQHTVAGGFNEITQKERLSGRQNNGPQQISSV